MPLPWKKSKSGRISRFVSDFQQSPKRGGSLVVETGFPTSLIDLFVKNRDRLKNTSSKQNNKKAETLTSPDHSLPLPRRRRVSSPPLFPPPLFPPPLPQKLDSADPSVISEIEGDFVGEENRDDGGDSGGDRGGGGKCVLMVVVFKVFLVAVLALSTKKLTVGITLSAFALLFLELAAARVFTLFNLCPDAESLLDSWIGKLIGKKRKEKREEPSPAEEVRRRNRVSVEIIEENQIPQPEKESPEFEKEKPLAEEEGKRMLTIRDVVFKSERSKSSKLKSKIVKKIVPKKLRSCKKKNKMKNKETVEVIEEEEEEESVTEVSSLFSDDVGSNPPLLESSEETEEEENGSKGDVRKVMVLIVIVLTGLLSGKVLAISMTLCSCLILRVFFSKKSQTSL